MKTLRFIFTSHILLAVVAAQVFQQVWMRTTDMPIIGFFLTVWISWKLGCLAAHADMTTVWAKQERLIATDIAEFQQWFDSLPEAARQAHGDHWAEVMGALKETHKKILAYRDRPYEPAKFLDVFPNPVRYFARRRERKALIDLRDSFNR